MRLLSPQLRVSGAAARLAEEPNHAASPRRTCRRSARTGWPFGSPERGLGERGKVRYGPHRAPLDIRVGRSPCGMPFAACARCAARLGRGRFFAVTGRTLPVRQRASGNVRDGAGSDASPMRRALSGGRDSDREKGGTAADRRPGGLAFRFRPAGAMRREGVRPAIPAGPASKPPAKSGNPPTPRID